MKQDVRFRPFHFKCKSAELIDGCMQVETSRTKEMRPEQDFAKQCVTSQLLHPSFPLSPDENSMLFQGFNLYIIQTAGANPVNFAGFLMHLSHCGLDSAS